MQLLVIQFKIKKFEIISHILYAVEISLFKIFKILKLSYSFRYLNNAYLIILYSDQQIHNFWRFADRASQYVYLSN